MRGLRGVAEHHLPWGQDLGCSGLRLRLHADVSVLVVISCAIICETIQFDDESTVRFAIVAIDVLETLLVDSASVFVPFLAIAPLDFLCHFTFVSFLVPVRP